MAPTPRKKGPGRWAIALGGGVATIGFIVAIAGGSPAVEADTPQSVAVTTQSIPQLTVSQRTRSSWDGDHEGRDDDHDAPRFRVTVPSGGQQVTTGPRLRTRSS